MQVVPDLGCLNIPTTGLFGTRIWYYFKAELYDKFLLYEHEHEKRWRADLGSDLIREVP